MFGNYFKHVLVLTLLAGLTYSLPQVKDGMAGAFDISESAAAINASTTLERGLVRISDASAQVIGRPTLKLTYDKSRNESALTATFNVIVYGGKKGVNIYKDWNPISSITNSTGYYNDMAVSRNFETDGDRLSIINDAQGVPMYVVPAGKQARFRATQVSNPQKMFAGSYYGSLFALYANSATSEQTGFKIEVPNNKSNTVTIVGEKSPYITSVTSPIKDGEKMIITGQRLSNISQILIDGADIYSKVSSVAITSTDGTSISFPLPAGLAETGHIIYVVDAKYGASNNFWFQVGTVPTITSVYPNPASVGTLVTIKGVKLQSNVSNMVEICGPSSCGNYDGTASSDGEVVTFTVPNIPTGDYNLLIIDTIANGNGSTSAVPFTVTVGSTTPTSAVNVSISPASPVSTNYSIGQAGVTLAVIDLKAMGSNISTLNNIQVGSDSTNASNLLTNIKIYQGTTLLGAVPSLVYNGSYYYGWVNVSNIALPVDAKVSLKLVADIPATAQSTYARLGITGLNFDAPGATTSGMPVYGSTMGIVTPVQCPVGYVCTGI